MKKTTKILFLQPSNANFTSDEISQICQSIDEPVSYFFYNTDTNIEAQNALDAYEYDVVVCHSKLNFSVWKLQEFSMHEKIFIFAGAIEDIIEKELVFAGFIGQMQIYMPGLNCQLILDEHQNQDSLYACPSIQRLISLIAFSKLLSDAHSTFGLDVSIYNSFCFSNLYNEHIERLIQTPLTMTPRQLLTHQAGIRGPKLEDKNDPLSILISTIQELDEEQSFFYSPYNYQILSLIIDAYTGNYTKYLEEKILPELGMTRSLISSSFPQNSEKPSILFATCPEKSQLFKVNEIDYILATDYLEKVLSFSPNIFFLQETLNQLIQDYFLANSQADKKQIKQSIDEELEYFDLKQADELLLLSEVEAFVNFYDTERNLREKGSKKYYEYHSLYDFFAKLRMFLLQESLSQTIEAIINPESYLGLNLFCVLEDIFNLQNALLEFYQTELHSLLLMESSQVAEKFDYIYFLHGKSHEKTFAIEHFSTNLGYQSAFKLLPKIDCRISLMSSQLKSQRDVMDLIIKYLFLAKDNSIFYLDERLAQSKIEKTQISSIQYWDIEDTISSNTSNCI